MNLIRTKSFELAVYARGDSAAQKLAIVIPGRLDTKDYIHNTSLVDDLAPVGYFALSFDPPGTWESAGEIELYTTSNYLKVIDELIECYGNRPTFLLGHSRGGSVAILAANNPFVSGIVPIMASYGSPTSPNPEAFAAGFQISHRDLPPGDLRTSEQKSFSLPLNYFIDGERYHPGEMLKEIVKPKLIVYGSRDEFTDPASVRELYEAIPGKKAIYEVDSEHDYRLYPEVIREVNDAICEFVKGIE